MRPFDKPLNVRCAECHAFLAGPLDTAIELPEFGRLDDICRSIVEPSFVHLGPEWLLVHPRWCYQWFDSYFTELDETTRSSIGYGRPLLGAKSFGCCGPMGDVSCPEEHFVGVIQGDCDREQWLKLYVDRIELSSQVSGEWELYDLKDSRRIMARGSLENNTRVGEWTIYQEKSSPVPVRKKEASGRGRWTERMEIQKEFDLVRLERYENGKLVEST